MAVVYDEIKKSFAPDTPVMIGGDLNTNTFDGNDIPGFTKLFNDPERLAKHMAAVEKYERVLPQAEENGFSYREFSSIGLRRQEHAAQAGLADGARHGMRRSRHDFDRNEGLHLGRAGQRAGEVHRS